jgi:outer membrane protein OmpA-like peptidoglycan-associated protein
LREPDYQPFPLTGERAFFYEKGRNPTSPFSFHIPLYLRIREFFNLIMKLFRLALIFLTLVLLSANLKAQTREKPWGLGAGAGLIDFRKPLTGSFAFQPAFHLSAHRFLTGAFDFNTHVLFVPAADYPVTEYPSKAEMPWMVDLSYSIHLKLNNGGFMRENFPIAPFGTLGIGGNFIPDRADVYIPIGGGIHFKLSQRISFRLESLVKISVNKDFQQSTHSASFIFNVGKRRVKKIGEDQEIVESIIWIDSDKDSIPDKDDLCPFIRGLAAFEGCPDAELLAMARFGKNRPAEGTPTPEMGPVYELGLPTLSPQEPLEADTGWVAAPETPSSETDSVATMNLASPSADSVSPSPGWINNIRFDGQPFTSIYFDNGSEVLRPDSQIKLAEIAHFMRENPELNLQIQGFTESEGNDRERLVLSIRRAFRAKYFLVYEHQISQSRILSDGFGEAGPAGDPKAAVGAHNRRVDFILIK